MHITSGRIQFTFGRRHGHGVNICILLYLLVFSFILQKSAGREHGFGFFFFTSTLLVSSLLLLSYNLSPTLYLFSGFGESGWAGGTVIGMESVTFFFPFSVHFMGFERRGYTQQMHSLGWRKVNE